MPQVARRWHRFYPTALVLAAVGLFSASNLFGGGAAPAPAALPRLSVKALNLPPELPIATGYTTVDAFAVNGGPGLMFTQPLDVVAVPGEKDRLFVVEKTGQIQVVTDIDGKNGGPKKSVFLDVAALLRTRNQTLQTSSEMGVLGLAFHPDYAHNGYFYISYNPAMQENGRRVYFDRVARFTVSKDNPNVADPASEQILFTSLDPADNHNGGCMRFGDDGYLYTSVGDGGAGNDTFNNARYVDKSFFAAIFRLDVDNKPESLDPNPCPQNSTNYPDAVHPGAYKIPNDNPLIGIKEYMGSPVDPKKVRTEMYATGLRNAWRFNFDPPTGRLFCAEIGQDLWEEIDIIVKGGNYGWSFYEGTHNGPRLNSKPANAKFIDPIYEYPHNATSDFNGKSITGGFVYRGTNLAELTGTYIFGDYTNKRIWSLREKDGKWTPKLLGTDGNVVSISPDPRNGDPLLCDLPTPTSTLQGKIKRLVRTGVQGAPPPALLSQVGAFKDLQKLTPADGLVPYQPNVAFWSDYAIKQRWFMVADGHETVGFKPTANWTFPAGMIWVKHFDIEMRRGDPTSTRRLETRIIYKTGDSPGSVYGITYRWRADNSDADLVPEGGADEVLDVTDNGKPETQTWHYPSQSECLTCHTETAGGALSFNTFQMNGNGEGAENQLESLKKAGYFAATIDLPAVKTLPAYAKATDASAPLEWRVRSYLAVNCVQCHQPGGVAQGLFDARATTATDAAGLINGALMNDRGDKAAKVVVPGDLLHSALLQRVEANGVKRMPPLATNEIDPGATALLSEWIKSLK